jgi:hypothetical protein
VSISGRVGRRDRQLPGGRAAGREPQAAQLDVAAEGGPHLRGQSSDSSLIRELRLARAAPALFP